MLCSTWYCECLLCGPSGASGTQQFLATKMARSLGTMEEFDFGWANWELFSARLDQFIAENDVDDGKKVATLLTVVGSETYQLLENFVFPDTPHEKTCEALKAALSAHFVTAAASGSATVSLPQARPKGR